MTDLLVTYGPEPQALCTTCRMVVPLAVALGGRITPAAVAGLEQTHVHDVAIYGWSPSCLPPQAREATRSYVVGSGEG